MTGGSGGLTGSRPATRCLYRRWVINLAYDDKGTGEPVVFISGRGGAGRTWQLHQVPAFLAAGYRCVIFFFNDTATTEKAEGFTTQTMVADTASLIESLGLGPARIVGVS